VALTLPTAQNAKRFSAGAPLCLPYVQSLPMDADLQAMVDAGKINVKTAAALDQLKPQTFCLHKSWGFGQISSWNLLLNQIVVDFDTKKNHSMQLQYAAETLQPLPDTHIFVRKVNEPGVLRDLAANKIPQLIELVLESFGGKATQDQLQRALAPEIVSEGNFKKWWESAKRAIRKDGRFSLPAKKTEAITIRDESTSFEDEVIGLFQKARKLKDQLNYLDQILKNLETFADKQTELQTVVAQVEEIATRNTRLNPSQAIELLISRDELCAKVPELKKGAIALPDLLREHQQTTACADRVSRQFSGRLVHPAALHSPVRRIPRGGRDRENPGRTRANRGTPANAEPRDQGAFHLLGSALLAL
jgi:hypothetical protein